MEKTCDNCSSQEGRHYCLLHSKIVKNMDISSCEYFEPKEDNEPREKAERMWKRHLRNCSAMARMMRKN